MNTIFADNLKKFRQQKNLTQEQAAQMLRVSTQSVSRWECGTTLPDVTMLPELARLYCVTVDDFFRQQSSAYENYAQRLAFVYQKTHDPEDFLRADLEFRKQQKAGIYSTEDRRIHGLIHQFMMTECRRKALQLYDSVIEEGVQAGSEVYWRARTARVNLLILTGQAEECIRRQRLNAEENEECAEEQILLLRAFRYAQRDEEGYAFFITASEKFPENARLLAAGAEICRAMGRYEEALGCLERAEQLDSSFWEPLFCRAHCYENMGEWKTAYRLRCEIAARLRREGHDVSADEEELRAGKCLQKAGIT